MKELGSKKNLVDQVDPNRRSFVARLLGAAAFVPPLIATFSLDALTAKADDSVNCNASDIREGYIGHNMFEATVTTGDPGNHIRGVVTFTITLPSTISNPNVLEAFVTVKIQLPHGLSATHGIVLFAAPVISQNLPLGNPGDIIPEDLSSTCNWPEFLAALNSGKASVALELNNNPALFVSGLIVPATNSFIINIPA